MGILASLHSLLYALAIPPWQAPDEIAHFEHARLLMEKRRPLSRQDADPELEKQIVESVLNFRALDYIYLPTPEPRPDRIAELRLYGRSRGLDRFSLSYVVCALILVPFAKSDVVLQLFVLRIFFVLLAALVVVVAFQTARMLFPENLFVRITAPSLVLFLPQQAFISSTVNDGNLTVLLCSLAVYSLVAFVQRPRASCLLWSGVATVGAMATKPTGWFLLPCIVVVTVVWLWKERQKIALWQTALFLLALLAGSSAGLLFRERELHILFLNQLAAKLNGETPWLSHPVETYGIFVSTAYRSFWAQFGWMNILVDEWWYWILGVLASAGFIGFARWLRREPHRSLRQAMSIQFAMICLSVTVLISWATVAPVGITFCQGRYLFPAIIPIAMVLATGWSEWIAESSRKCAAVGFLLGAIFFDGMCLFRYIIPFFYL